MIPKHIAIIMDGNGRWARKRGLPRIAGHTVGAENVKKIVKSCLKFGVKYLTLYAFSTENWLRPKKEVNALFKLLDNFLGTQIKLFRDNNVRFYMLGEKYKLEPYLRKKIDWFENETRENKAMVLNVALSYGSRREIIDAVKELCGKIKKGVMDISEINEQVFSRHLYTRNCPDPDLLIRTSGEMRLSNFLLWQLSYAEIYVTPKFWPDFHEADLKEAIEEYKKRERRFGK